MVKINRDTGNIYLNSGELLKFSGRGLAEVLADEGRCVCCGLFFGPEEELTKTREHVVPEWVIDYCELGSTRFGKPNNQTGQYAQLTVRCCKRCNQSYSDLFEKPISKAFKEGYRSISSLMSTTSGKNLLFAWVAFIAAKKRLHSALHRYDPDPRAASKLFEDEKGLEDISWLLALPTSLRFGNEDLFARFMMVLPTLNRVDGVQMFDMAVDPTANTAMITVGDTSLVCGFSHSCPREITDARLKGIPRDIYFNQMQVKEIYCELCVEALSFEQKHYRIKEYNGKLSIGMDEKTPARKIMDIPRSFMTEILLRASGELITICVASEAYWNYVTSNLSNGCGSFFSGRGREPYFDPDLFGNPGQEVTEEMYKERVQKLRLLEKNKDPLSFEEILEAYARRS